MVVLDSMTNQGLGVAKDEYGAGFTERPSKWGAAEETFEYWGKRVRKIGMRA